MNTVVRFESGAVGRTDGVMNGGAVTVGDTVTVVCNLQGVRYRRAYIAFGVVVAIITPRRME